MRWVSVWLRSRLSKALLFLTSRHCLYLNAIDCLASMTSFWPHTSFASCRIALKSRRSFAWMHSVLHAKHKVPEIIRMRLGNCLLFIRARYWQIKIISLCQKLFVGHVNLHRDCVSPFCSCDDNPIVLQASIRPVHKAQILCNLFRSAYWHSADLCCKVQLYMDDEGPLCRAPYINDIQIAGGYIVCLRTSLGT